jgi:hypothetical protein
MVIDLLFKLPPDVSQEKSWIRSQINKLMWAYPCDYVLVD